MPTLMELERLLAAKFREICELISNDLGLGHFEKLSLADRQRVEEEAERAALAWDEAKLDTVEGVAIAITPLQKLLAEHLEINEQIIEFLDKRKT